MKLVVDTSVILAVLLNEPHRQMILDITKGAELYAPASLHWEIGNAFSAMFKQKRLTLDQAHAGLATYRHIPIRLEDVELAKAVDLAATSSIYAYDAYMLVCARKIGAPLISLDQKLLRTARECGIIVMEVSL